LLINTKINLIYLSNIQKTKSNDHIRFVPYFYNHNRNLYDPIQKNLWLLLILNFSYKIDEILKGKFRDYNYKERIRQWWKNVTI